MLLMLLIAACKDGPPRDSAGSVGIDECATTRWYPDGDGDGWGEDIVGTAACEAPLGYVNQGGDCNDSDPATHPAMSEQCNTIDDDCDGRTDEGQQTVVLFADDDGDGHGDLSRPAERCGPEAGFVESYDDCDDGEPTVYPGADELCDRLDNDCNGLVDISDPSLVEVFAFYPDQDSDQFGTENRLIYGCFAPPGYVGNNTDCDDTDSSVNPAAAEICYDLRDQDCDGRSDDYTGACGVIPDGDDICVGSVAPMDPAYCAAGVAAVSSAGLTFTSLQSAVDAAAAGEVITVCPGRFGANLVVGVSPLTLVGFGGALSQLDGLGGRVVSLPSGAEFTAIDLGFEGGGGSGGGAIAGEDVELCLTRCAFGFGAVTDLGGALRLEGTGALWLDESVLAGNAAGRDGGAVYVDGAYTVTIDDTIFATNEAGGAGGAIALFGDARTTIIDSAFVYNVAAQAGGLALSGDLSVSNTDWGAGGSDNAPDDLYSPSVGLSYAYGAAASFSCFGGICN